MNTINVLKYGSGTLLGTLAGVPKSEWETAGVCGVWSVKDILAHLTSYELLLADVLTTLLDGGPTPYLEAMNGPGEFNDSQVELRRNNSPDEALAEYEQAHANVMSLAVQIPKETYRQNGTIPWYGEDYDLQDYIIYTNYAHKREHSAEINVFRDRLQAQSE